MLSQRFSLLGLIALVPINFCILAVTISQGWKGTPFVNSFLLLLNMAALLYEYSSLKILLVEDQQIHYPAPKSIQQYPGLSWPLMQIGLATLCILLSFFIDKFLAIPGAIYLTLVFLFVLRSQGFQTAQYVVLACFYLFISIITFAAFLEGSTLPMAAILGSVLAIGFLSWIVSMLLPILRKREVSVE